MNKTKQMVRQQAKKEGSLRSVPQVVTSSYDINEELGRGKFSVVKKCTHKTSGIAYAAKFVRKRRKGKDCTEELLQEVGMLKLKHPNLVELMQVFDTTQEFIIITEYAAGGELFQHIMEEDGLAESVVKDMLCQLLSGLGFLHGRDIVHLDLKPQNILLTDAPPNGVIKLCDFGFARTIKCRDEIRDIIGTPDYVAPEVLNYEPLHTSSDMWSVGVLSYVMLTGCSPFTGSTKMETFCNITQIKYDFPQDLFGEISKDALQFIQSLLVKEPEDRMTVCESLRHRWLLQQDKAQGSVLTDTTPRSSKTSHPLTSPVGCRRALTSADVSTDSSSPLKRCKCVHEEQPNNPCHQCWTTASSTDHSINGLMTSSEVNSTTDHSINGLMNSSEANGTTDHSINGLMTSSEANGTTDHSMNGLTTSLANGTTDHSMNGLMTSSQANGTTDYSMNGLMTSSEANGTTDHSINGLMTSSQANCATDHSMNVLTTSLANGGTLSPHTDCLQLLHGRELDKQTRLTPGVDACPACSVVKNGEVRNSDILATNSYHFHHSTAIKHPSQDNHYQPREKTHENGHSCAINHSYSKGASDHEDLSSNCNKDYYTDNTTIQFRDVPGTSHSSTHVHIT